jgi:predicted nucleic acid-binding protein
MPGPVLLDTGPLVSYLVNGSQHNRWAIEQWKVMRPPLLTCEPVLTETAFLLEREGYDPGEIFPFFDSGTIRIALNIQDEYADLRALMHRYRNRPMSLADACLVRLSELHPDSEVLTLDSDFKIYRRYGNRVIPTRMP